MIIETEEVIGKEKSLKCSRAIAYIDKQKILALHDQNGEVTKYKGKIIRVTEECYAKLYTSKIKVSPTITIDNSDV